MIFRMILLKAHSWFVVGCKVMSRRGSSRGSISNAWVAYVVVEGCGVQVEEGQGVYGFFSGECKERV